MSPVAAGCLVEMQSHAREIPCCFTRTGKRERVHALVAAFKAALRAEGWV